MSAAETRTQADDPRVPGTSRGGNLPFELAGLLILLALLAVVLATRDRLLPYSDPATWYAFGMDFFDSFASVPLAYLFPFYLSKIIAVLGPVQGYLANVPVLVAMAAAVYGLARQAAWPHAQAGIAALTALAWVLAIDPQMLLALTSPYRDPLSYLLLLLSCMLLIGHRRGGVRAAAPASGACLALACSAREASLVMLLPFLVYAVASRRDDPDLRFWRPALAFGAGFAFAIAPLLFQNYLLSGNPLMPGQSMGSPPDPSTLPAGLARTLAYLGEHYGLVGGTFIALGVLAAVLQRLGAALYLLLPALAAYVVFYSLDWYGHDFPIPRYLFVLDLFAAPLFGLGALLVVETALRTLTQGTVRRRAAFGALALVFAFATTRVLELRRVEHKRPTLFRLVHAERMRTLVLDQLPRGSRVVGEFPVGEFMRAFTGDHLDLFSTRNPRQNLADALADREVVYIVSFNDLEAPNEHNRLFREQFAVQRIAALPASRWGVRMRHRPTIYLDRVRLR